MIFVQYFKIKAIASTLVLLLLLVFLSPLVYAATSPTLGFANTFGILSSTYTNTVGGTTINGDLGYTTGPVTAPTVNGTTHGADSVYTQAGLDQGTALANLNSQPCTFTFAAGAVDLASDATHGTVGVYTPGVYCITGSASIGGGGTITLNGSGAYIFRMTGAFNTSAGSIVALSGASACDTWWTPGGATTLGANSTFFGTDIDASGITIGNAVTWTGKALAFGGTISTASDTINVPTCSSGGSSNSSASSNSSSSGTSNAPSVCKAAVINGTPRIITSRRISSDSIFLDWGPYAGRDSFVVEYGTVNGTWSYNTKVTGFSTTLKSLPVNTPIWVRVAATDGCAIGSFSEAKLLGSPLFPNAGFAPHTSSLDIFSTFTHWFKSLTF